MAKREKAKNYSALSVSDVAELLGVTDRGVRKWIYEKGLPAKSAARGFTLDWHATLRWYVAYRIEENSGTSGTGGPKSGPGVPEETYEQALARRTRAEADLKELELAGKSGEVVAIADIERVYSAAFKSIQTLLLAIPTAVTPRVLGMADRNQVYALLDQSVRDALTNLPGTAAAAIRSATPARGQADGEAAQ
jgi:phage terminase Nu1 subunit (DNA packaging protein)